MLEHVANLNYDSVIKDIDALNTIYNMRLFLEENEPGFPENKCLVSSKLINKETGLDIVKGGWIPPIKRDAKRKKTDYVHKAHFWNYHKDSNTYIDITQDQFNETTKKIIILPKNNQILIDFKENLNFLKENNDYLTKLHEKYLSWMKQKYKSTMTTNR